MDTRIEWTFTPLLSLQVYAQPFVSAGRYSRFKEFTAPRTYDFAVYGKDRGTIDRSASGVYTVDPDGAGLVATPSFAGSIVLAQRSSWCGSSSAKASSRLATSVPAAI